MAAGGSSRLGEPKQLLPWNNKTLIENAIQTAIETSKADVFVVLGANAERISKVISPYEAEVIQNPNWEQGLGNSIAFGMDHIKHSHYDGVLIMLADQPLITSSYLKEIISAREGKAQEIIATNYGTHKLGVPALFSKYYFEALSKLDGDKGAKAILQKHQQHIKLVEGSHLVSDIDTKEDYKLLNKKTNHQ